MEAIVSVWNGAENRQLRLQRPCSCGCDYRNNDGLVGYLTGSTPEGEGFTILLHSEIIYQTIKKVIEAQTKYGVQQIVTEE